jgi:hypothetical protein
VPLFSQNFLPLNQYRRLLALALGLFRLIKSYTLGSEPWYIAAAIAKWQTGKQVTRKGAKLGLCREKHNRMPL